MNPSALLLATFILSVAGLFAFIWSLRNSNRGGQDPHCFKS